ncbi:hypothetical protein YTPLAS18_30960 [Nitrospira sp.]|nr:hypothetical protein YTPLAS18_30960 [Nitrospira sp.]
MKTTPAGHDTQRANPPMQHDAAGGTHGTVQETTSTTADDLSKVRELLFGSYTREQARRVSHLEDSLTQRIETLAQETRNHLDAMTSSLKSHVDTLAAQIHQEQDARTESVAALLRQLKEFEQTVAQSTARIDHHASEESRAVRQHLADQEKTLLSKLQTDTRQLSTAMQEALDELRKEKVTRASLAELFVKSAESLSGRTSD